MICLQIAPEAEKEWKTLAENSARCMQLPVPKLVTLGSSCRFVITPTLDYILKHADRLIAVVLPTLISRDTP